MAQEIHAPPQHVTDGHTIPSMIDHIKRNPKANADRFTKTPKNKQKEKNPNSLTK